MPLRGGLRPPGASLGALTNTVNTARSIRMDALPAIRLSSYALEQAKLHGAAIRARGLVLKESPTLTQACVSRGLSAEMSALCGGLLATVVDDLVAIGRLPYWDFDRTKRKTRVLAAAEEPALFALKVAMAASPINGRAAVAHWDAVCSNKWERHEIGKLAWLVGLDTDAAQRYARKVEKRA